LRASSNQGDGGIFLDAAGGECGVVAPKIVGVQEQEHVATGLVADAFELRDQHPAFAVAERAVLDSSKPSTWV
jgi:hypothetical protein